MATLWAAASCAVAAEPKVLPLSSLSISIQPGECVVNGRKVVVRTATTLRLEPLVVRRVTGEPHKLWLGKPAGFAKGTRLKQCVSRRTTLPGCLRPGSLVVRDAPDGRPYELAKDYLVDELWGMLGRTASGRIGPDTTVYVDYAYTFSRIDTVQVSADGKVSRRKGVEDLRCPHPPGADAGCRALANLFLDYNVMSLFQKDIYPIGPPPPSPTAEELRQKYLLVANARRKLDSGGTLRIGFWGDSVTVGYTASRPETRFVDAFVARLRKEYPNAKIEFFNAGVSGSNTVGRLPGLEKDVLRKQPDLVVIEFVNDMGFSPGVIRENYTRAIEGVRGIGAEPIIITPHFTMPQWMKLKDLWGEDRRPACLALHQIAAEKKVALADASRAWQDLCRQGIPYTSLLYNRINHPDDRGHTIFVDELMTFFGDP